MWNGASGSTQDGRGAAGAATGRPGNADVRRRAGIPSLSGRYPGAATPVIRSPSTAYMEAMSTNARRGRWPLRVRDATV
jgi:hypothetical protein